MKRFAQPLASRLKKNNLTIAFAESITCGLAAHRLGNVIGASEFLTGSVVCYNVKVKTSLLKIKHSLIKKYTAESQQATDALAKNLRLLFDADICVALTGLASPGGSETRGKPVGTVFYSVYYRKKFYRLRKKYNGTPLLIKKKACDEVYKFVLTVLENLPSA